MSTYIIALTITLPPTFWYYMALLPNDLCTYYIIITHHHTHVVCLSNHIHKQKINKNFNVTISTKNKTTSGSCYNSTEIYYF